MHVRTSGPSLASIPGPLPYGWSVSSEKTSIAPSPTKQPCASPFNPPIDGTKLYGTRKQMFTQWHHAFYGNSKVKGVVNDLLHELVHYAQKRDTRMPTECDSAHNIMATSLHRSCVYAMQLHRSLTPLRTCPRQESHQPATVSKAATSRSVRVNTDSISHILSL